MRGDWAPVNALLMGGPAALAVARAILETYPHDQRLLRARLALLLRCLLRDPDDVPVTHRGTAICRACGAELAWVGGGASIRVCCAAQAFSSVRTWAETWRGPALWEMARHSQPPRRATPRTAQASR